MTQFRNRLLHPPDSRRAIRFAGLERVELAFGDVLHESGARMGHVYFPDESAVSLIATHGQGANPVEVALVGREGVVGASVALGVDVSPVRAAVQGAGEAMRATPAQFRAGLAHNGGLRRGVLRYQYELTSQVMQIAACNRNHSIEQRLARWLLMMRERTLQDRVVLTQRFLGAMLGVRRAGVNEAAGSLQRRKLIRLGRGRMDILDLDGVEDAACACYGALRLNKTGTVPT
ncbi:MAG TPA: Crp/Fnr family transcriptional regulator [Burkholderiales bacterium]|nr:Crp/Fnr family transcriptional regulator [Burkholderiales bacterium]